MVNDRQAYCFKIIYVILRIQKLYNSVHIHHYASKMSDIELN